MTMTVSCDDEEDGDNGADPAHGLQFPLQIMTSCCAWLLMGVMLGETGTVGRGVSGQHGPGWC